VGEAIASAQVQYKKVAGTSAVFLKANHKGPSPVERDGLSWSADELNANELSAKLFKPAVNSVLALEGLEEYDPPTDGDCRTVLSVGSSFVYVAKKKAWVEQGM